MSAPESPHVWAVELIATYDRFNPDQWPAERLECPQHQDGGADAECPTCNLVGILDQLREKLHG